MSNKLYKDHWRHQFKSNGLYSSSCIVRSDSLSSKVHVCLWSKFTEYFVISLIHITFKSLPDDCNIRRKEFKGVGVKFIKITSFNTLRSYSTGRVLYQSSSKVNLAVRDSSPHSKQPGTTLTLTNYHNTIRPFV